VQSQALKFLQVNKVKVSHPGWQHYAWSEYVRAFGDGDATKAAQVMEERNQKRQVWKGIDGVFVKDADIRKIEFSEEIAAMIETGINVPGLEDGSLSQEDLEQNMRNLQQKGVGDLFGSGSGTSFGSMPSLPGLPPTLAIGDGNIGTPGASGKAEAKAEAKGGRGAKSSSPAVVGCMQAAPVPGSATLNVPPGIGGAPPPPPPVEVAPKARGGKAKADGAAATPKDRYS